MWLRSVPAGFNRFPFSSGTWPDKAEAVPQVGEPVSPWKQWFFRRAPETGDVPAPESLEAEHVRTAKMARLEAVLLIAEGALSPRRLSQLATLADTAEARKLLDQLNESYDQTGSAFRIERVATGYQLLTRPEFAFWLDRLHQRQARLKLSPPAMETLSIVAYRQPITRADIEAIRGVQCAEMLKQLMDRNLVRIAGEDDSLGRPFLYQTTRQFLELFGLRSLDDLPMAESLRYNPKASSGEASNEQNQAEPETEDAPEENAQEQEEDGSSEASEGDVAAEEAERESEDAEVETEEFEEENGLEDRNSAA